MSMWLSSAYTEHRYMKSEVYRYVSRNNEETTLFCTYGEVRMVMTLIFLDSIVIVQVWRIRNRMIIS